MIRALGRRNKNCCPQGYPLGQFGGPCSYTHLCTFHYCSLVPLTRKLSALEAWRRPWYCMGQHPAGPLCADLSLLESCMVSGACNFDSSCSIRKNSAGMTRTNPLYWPKESEENLPKLPCGHFGLDSGDTAMQIGFQCSLAGVSSLLREKTTCSMLRR